MRLDFRRLFPLFLLLLAGVGLVWAVTFEPFEPADFTFINGTEIQSVDPAKVTGVPEGRIINALFEGLYRSLPVEGEAGALEPQPALAESHTLSEDGRTYTFTIRRDAYWSRLQENEQDERLRQITAHDFLWSWRRFLHPETASQYAYQLFYVKNGKKYSTGATALEKGDRVEIELYDRPYPQRQFPSGTMLSGVLVETIPAMPTFEEDVEVSNEEQKRREQEINKWMDSCVWVVDVAPEIDGEARWDLPGTRRRFHVGRRTSDPDAKRSHSVLLHFGEVGIRAPDDHTFVVELQNPTAFFLHLCAFYPMYPVNRECVEEFGVPDWTKPGSVVSSGPFLLKFRRIRDRIRLVRNPNYWNVDEVSLATVDALVGANPTTGLNMYLDGQADWITTVPGAILPDLKKRDDLLIAPLLGVYFYRFNTTRPPLDDPRVRRALNMAVDKQEICEFITRGGQIPARSLVPPLPGYEAQDGDPYDPEGAKRLLDEARADGVVMKKFEVMFNSGAGHEPIALAVAEQWRKHLGIEVETRTIEWGVFLDEVRQMQYDIARAGWIGDYPDPNTFLDMFVTGGENNETGWSNPRYDELIELAGGEADPQRRLELLAEAEQIFVEEMPVMPLYFYVSINMAQPYVQGFSTNVQDIHNLSLIRVDQKAKQRALTGEAPQ